MRPQPHILGETYSFQRISWKSFRFLYGIFFLTVFFLTIGRRTIGSDLLVLSIGLGAFLLFQAVVIYGMLTKITISPEGISYRSPLKSFQYDWNSVQTASMYILSKNSKNELPAHRYEEKFYVREKFIFLAGTKFFSPGVFQFPNASYVDFHYDRKAWELIGFYTSGSSRNAHPNTFNHSPNGNMGFTQ
jgi:hypothetical protein